MATATATPGEFFMTPANDGKLSSDGVPYRRMAPTKDHRVALVDVGNGTVEAYNRKGVKRTFGGDNLADAMRYAGIKSGSDMRYGRRGKASKKNGLAYWIVDAK
jgi:hypothetical protein